MEAQKDPEEYKVGYKKPPKTTQFKKGQSGNPKGRKKGSRNKLSYELPTELLGNAVIKEAYREIVVNEPDGQVTMPTIEAVLRSVMIKAVKGNVPAQKLALDITSKEERRNRKKAEKRSEWLIEYKKHWEEEIARGYDGDGPYPHPDQIKVKVQTGKLYVVGPLTKEEYQENEFYKTMLNNNKNNLKTLLQDVETEKDPEIQQSNQEEIAYYEEIIPILKGIVYDDSEDLSLYAKAKKEGYYKAYMKGPEAMSKYVDERFGFGDTEPSEEEE